MLSLFRLKIYLKIKKTLVFHFLFLDRFICFFDLTNKRNYVGVNNIRLIYIWLILFFFINKVIMKIKDHLIVRVHVQEVQIVFHHHIIINNHHHNGIIIDRQEIIIFMIEEILVIDQIIFITMAMIIEVVVVIDLIKRLIYIQIVNLD
jgi:hypothetical protein